MVLIEEKIQNSKCESKRSSYNNLQKLGQTEMQRLVFEVGVGKVDRRLLKGFRSEDNIRIAN